MRPELLSRFAMSLNAGVVRSVDGAGGHGVQDSCVTGRERQAYTCASVTSETRAPGGRDRRITATVSGPAATAIAGRVVAPDLGPLWSRSNDPAGRPARSPASSIHAKTLSNNTLG